MDVTNSLPFVSDSSDRPSATTTSEDYILGLTSLISTPLSTSSSDVSPKNAISALIFIQFAVGWLGIIGNFAVCFVFLFRLKERNQTNLLITHQAFVDLASSLMLVLYNGYAIIGDPTTNIHPLRAFACFFWTRITLFALFAISTFNLSLISLERYTATTWPLAYPRVFSAKRLRILIALVWPVAPICQYLIAWTTHSYEDGVCVLTRSPALVGILLFIWEFLIPVTVMTYSFSSVVRRLRTMERKIQGVNPLGLASTTMNMTCNPPENIVSQLGAGPSQLPSITGSQFMKSSTHQPRDGPEQLFNTRSYLGQPPIPPTQPSSQVTLSTFCPGTPARKSPIPAATTTRVAPKCNGARRRNATKSLVLVYVMYVICWSPNQFAFFQLSLGGRLNFSGSFYQMSVVLAILNTCINPFIYALRHRAYKAELKRMYRSIFRRAN